MKERIVRTHTSTCVRTLVAGGQREGYSADVLRKSTSHGKLFVTETFHSVLLAEAEVMNSMVSLLRSIACHTFF